MNSQINYNRFSVTSEMDNSSQRLMKKMQSAVPADCIVNLNISKENSDYVAVAKFKGPSLEAVIRKTSPDYFEALDLVSADFENRVPLWSEAFQSNPISASRREQASETSSLSRPAGATEPTTSFQRAQPKDLKGAEQRTQKLTHNEQEGRAGHPKSQPTQQRKATRDESGKSGKQQPTTGTSSREQHQQYNNI
ncbi:MAG: hypothetical protein ACK41T_02835 [Pseudobdellovibrio sp.]